MNFIIQKIGGIMEKYKIILASQSPRRKELLELIGIKKYDVIVSHIDEAIEENITIKEKVKKIAYQKANAVFKTTHGNRIVIGSDTIVEKNQKIYGKPKDEQDAIRMLKEFSNSKVNVITAIAVLIEENGKSTTKIDYDLAEVYIKKMTEEEIKRWINTGESLDKAGAFAIQGQFCVHIQKINGNYTTIMGLPTQKLYDILKEYINF